jgi:hypothetical protein
MTNKQLTAFLSVLIGLLLIFSFYIGYNSGKKNNEPISVHDTIWNIDTITHVVRDTFPWYIVKRDSIVYRDTVFKDVDTSEILKNYFAIKYLTQVWEDSLLLANQELAITENSILDSRFTYKIKRPQYTIIEGNTYNYSRYLYLGLQSDLKYASVSLFWADRRMLVGAGYNPFEKRVSLTGAFKIGQFK